jgi:flagellar secretion chaperone FliS
MARKQINEPVQPAASPLQVVVMLYDNALISMNASKDAIRAGDHVRKEALLDRTEEILTALVNCLDLRQNDMAADLRSLYCYVLSELGQARTDKTTSRVERCETVIKDLRNVWLELEASMTPLAGYGAAIAA